MQRDVAAAANLKGGGAETAEGHCLTALQAGNPKIKVLAGLFPFEGGQESSVRNPSPIPLSPIGRHTQGPSGEESTS